MIDMQRHIQDIANAHGITFEQASQSVCESLTKAYGDEDVKIVYKDGAFKGMRKIGLSELLDKLPSLDECMKQAKQFMERKENVTH